MKDKKRWRGVGLEISISLYPENKILENREKSLIVSIGFLVNQDFTMSKLLLFFSQIAVFFRCRFTNGIY